MSQVNSFKTVPDQLDPPVIGKVTYHSVELSWHPPSSYNDIKTDLVYCVQEEDIERGKGFVTVYEGSDVHRIFTGLSSSTQYCYRIRASNDTGPGPWSPVIIISTASHAITSEHLHKAVLNNDVDTVRSIIENNPNYLNIPDIQGSSPLMAACKKGRKRVVDLLLTMGADPEFQNSAGKTSLMEACYHGYNECVMLLHNAGASWMTRDLSGMSALHWASDGGHYETVELLLTEGVPVDGVSDHTISRWTPLLKVAATNGSTIVARVLIKHGANVNQRDQDGQTPLMYASLNGHNDLIEVLLHSGADPKMKSKHNKTSLDFAVTNDREETVVLLKAALEEYEKHEKNEM